MKILQVSRQFFPSIGGLENVTFGLSYALNQQGHRSDVVTLRTIFNQKTEAQPTELYQNILVFRIPHIGIRRYPIAPAIANFLLPYEVIHIHAVDFFVDFLSFSKNRHRKPLVVNTHGGIFHTKWLYRLKQLYFRTVTRMSLNRADAIICDSHHDFDLFKKIVDTEKLHIIGNGVDLRPFVGIRKNIERGLLLGIGRVVENKGIERIIKLLPDLVHEFPEVKLVWIGEDVEGRVSSLMAKAHDLGVDLHVHFLGQVSTLRLTELLSRAHIFVSAATYEAFGISTIEAMSSGTVPIVTPVGIHPEVVEKSVNGFFCSYEGTEALELIRQVMTLSNTKIIEIGANARKSTIKYSWDNVVNSYVSVYNSVMR